MSERWFTRCIEAIDDATGDGWGRQCRLPGGSSRSSLLIWSSGKMRERRGEIADARADPAGRQTPAPVMQDDRARIDPAPVPADRRRVRQLDCGRPLREGLARTADEGGGSGFAKPRFICWLMANEVGAADH